LFVVTVIGCYVAPEGTVTVNEVVVAADTVALTAPKKTILFAGVVLKLVPLMVTADPTAPELGAKELIVG
jgi:hypothetical protein